MSAAVCSTDICPGHPSRLPGSVCALKNVTPTRILMSSNLHFCPNIDGNNENWYVHVPSVLSSNSKTVFWTWALSSQTGCRSFYQILSRPRAPFIPVVTISAISLSWYLANNCHIFFNSTFLPSCQFFDCWPNIMFTVWSELDIKTSKVIGGRSGVGNWFVQNFFFGRDSGCFLPRLDTVAPTQAAALLRNAGTLSGTYAGAGHSVRKVRLPPKVHWSPQTPPDQTECQIWVSAYATHVDTSTCIYEYYFTSYVDSAWRMVLGQCYWWLDFQSSKPVPSRPKPYM